MKAIKVPQEPLKKSDSIFTCSKFGFKADDMAEVIQKRTDYALKMEKTLDKIYGLAKDPEIIELINEVQRFKRNNAKEFNNPKQMALPTEEQIIDDNYWCK